MVGLRETEVWEEEREGGGDGGRVIVADIGILEGSEWTSLACVCVCVYVSMDVCVCVCIYQAQPERMLLGINYSEMEGL